MLSKLLPSVRWQRFAGIDLIDSTNGLFHVRRGTFDVICASPDFEYPDVRRLMSVIQAKRAAGKRVLFLDIGANIGVYSVRIGNRFKSDSGVELIGFEPFPESFSLFSKNIRENALQGQCRTFNFGLFNSEGELDLALNSNDAGSNSLISESEANAKRTRVQVKTLDAFIDSLNFDNFPEVLVIKLDVEGAEKFVLEGGRRTLGRAKEVHLLVEDFLDSTLSDFLTNYGFAFRGKSSPYNSYWVFGSLT